MSEIEAIFIDYLNDEDSRAYILILPLIFYELYRRFFNKLFSTFSSLDSFLLGGDVHEPSVLVAADEVYIIVIFQERMRDLLY